MAKKTCFPRRRTDGGSLRTTYAGVDLETRMASVRLKHDIKLDWHLAEAALTRNATRDIQHNGQ